MTEFDAARVIERGRRLSAPSAHPPSLTDAAEADLAEIWAYVALEASEAIATRLLGQDRARMCARLEFPLSGSPREPFAPGLRAIFEGNYAIYYVISPDTELVVVRVLHGARDAAAHRRARRVRSEVSPQTSASALDTRGVEVQTRPRPENNSRPLSRRRVSDTAARRPSGLGRLTSK